MDPYNRTIYIVAKVSEMQRLKRIAAGIASIFFWLWTNDVCGADPFHGQHRWVSHFLCYYLDSRIPGHHRWSHPHSDGRCVESGTDHTIYSNRPLHFFMLKETRKYTFVYLMPKWQGKKNAKNERKKLQPTGQQNKWFFLSIDLFSENIFY